MRVCYPAVMSEPHASAGTDRARSLRQTATYGERAFWGAVRGRKPAGLKFRRQTPIGPYVADFYVTEHRLIVEIDGASHDHRIEADAQRQRWLESRGYRVLRFQERDVLSDIEAVVQTILSSVGLRETLEPSPNPLPGGEGSTPTPLPEGEAG